MRGRGAVSVISSPLRLDVIRHESESPIDRGRSVAVKMGFDLRRPGVAVTTRKGRSPSAVEFIA